MTGPRDAAVRVGLAAAAAGLIAAGPGLSFASVFAATGEPATLHFHATYVAHGRRHQLEVWRDHDRRVKRVTDGSVTTIASHAPGDAEFRMTIVDPARRVVTTIDRTNLYRLGNFVDWYDLTHGLRYPKAAYHLAAAAAPPGAAAVPAECAWYDLAAGRVTTHICWSTRDRLPMLIVDSGGVPIWRVTAVDRDPVVAKIFDLADRGFVHVDANRDLDRD